MVRWHHRFNGYKFEQGPGDGEGGETWSPWSHKESDTTKRLNNSQTLPSRVTKPLSNAVFSGSWWGRWEERELLYSTQGQRSREWRRTRQPTLVFLPENPMDRGDWRATAHGVAKSQTGLSD